MNFTKTIRWAAALLLLLQITACLPQADSDTGIEPEIEDSEVEAAPVSTPLPRRESYSPGQLVDYTARSGDTLPGLASHFNTTIREIQEANPIIPKDATTMPFGFPMKIPIYYQSLWGTPFQILPDSQFVYGPAQIGFDPVAYVRKQPGWFKEYTVYASGENRTGGEVVNLLAQNYSVSPRLILAIIEFQTGGLSNPTFPKDMDEYPLGYRDYAHKGLYLQLSWAINYLNNGYYDWRYGKLKGFDLSDGRLERPDPWQNAGTVALQYYFARILDQVSYNRAVNNEGFSATYSKLFGNPWETNIDFIPAV